MNKLFLVSWYFHVLHSNYAPFSLIHNVFLIIWAGNYFLTHFIVFPTKICSGPSEIYIFDTEDIISLVPNIHFWMNKNDKTALGIIAYPLICMVITIVTIAIFISLWLMMLSILIYENIKSSIYAIIVMRLSVAFMKFWIKKLGCNYIYKTLLF